MITVIGLTGYAQSGKDTGASFLVEKGFKRLAFADILRQSLYNLNPIVEAEVAWYDYCSSDPSPISLVYVRVQEIVDRWGWDYAKTHFTEIRELLQRFGTEVGRELYGENFWVERVTRQIHGNDRVVITDVRFPNEEAAVHNLGGKVYRIVRPGTGAANGHASESAIDSLFVDGVIPNNGSVEEYREAVLSVTGVN
jgi:hypothetical protein